MYLYNFSILNAGNRQKVHLVAKQKRKNPETIEISGFDGGDTQI